MEKILKNSHLKAQGCIIFSLLIVLLIPIFVSAMDFDNVISKPSTTFDGKDYRDISLLNKYPPIKVDNAFGLGATIEEAYISEHTETCSVNCYSNIQIKMYDKGSLVDDIRFDNPVRSYKLYIKTGENDVDDYGYANIGAYPNGSEIKKYQIIGSHKEPIWKEYNLGDVVDAGVYEIKLEGQKKPSRTVDWQIKTSGIWTTDWATWGSGFQGECYQEYANVSETCGALATGSYADNGVAWNAGGGITNIIDGNWATSQADGVGVGYAIVYINYSVPPGALSTSQWETRLYSGGTPIVNSSINASCWNTNKLQFRIESANDVPAFVNASCWTGTYWETVRFIGSANNEIYEEAMIWNMSSSSVTLNSPADNYNSINPLVTVNCSVNMVGATLVNVSLYHNASGTFERNQTINLTGTTNSTTFTGNFPLGKTLWSCQGCDSDGDCGFATTNRTIDITNFVTNNQTYNATVFETSFEPFSINFSYVPTAYTLGNVYLIYNGTSNLASSSGTGTTVSSKSILIPTVATSGTNLSFYWSIGLVNGSGTYYFNTSSLNQTVNKGTPLIVNSTTCDAGYSSALNFTSFYETNRTNINFTSVKYYITYGLSGNSSANQINNSLSNINAFSICINNSQPYYNIGYGEIQYQVDGESARRYYIFSGTRVTNTTVNIPIYSLDTTLSTSFLITAQNTALTPYENYYIGLLRWYPEINSYQTVELGKTDDKGQTVLRVKTEDVDYRFAIYQPDGTLIQLFAPVRLICQTNPCTYTLYVDTNPLDLTTWNNIQESLTFDTTTNKFTFIWNDPSQASQTMNLTVYKQGTISSEIVCSTTSIGYTGTMICDVTGQTGTLKAEVYRTASPSVLLAQLIAEIRTSFADVTGGGTMGLFIGAIVLIFFVMVGIISPVLVIILGIVSLIPLYFLGSINWMILTGIAVMGGIILHFMRRTG